MTVPRAFIDPRSGAATSLIGSFPLIPGRGIGNNVRLTTLSVRLGREVQRVDPKTVADIVVQTLRGLKLKYPNGTTPKPELRKLRALLA